VKSKNILKNPSRAKINWFIALLLVLVIGWLHWTFRQTAGGFWRDEVNLINLAASHSLAEMQKDSFPLLMPVIVHAWLAWVGPIETLRWLGFVIGVGILGALCFSSWQLRRRPPWLGLILFAANNTLIAYGDSLRAYGLGCFGIIVTLSAAGAFVLRPGWKRAGWLTLAAVFSVQALYSNAVLVAAICLGAAFVFIRQKAWRSAGQILGAGALAAVSLLPYVFNFSAAQKSSVLLRTGLDWPNLRLSLENTISGS
jgi:hypothetical protein